MKVKLTGSLPANVVEALEPHAMPLYVTLGAVSLTVQPGHAAAHVSIPHLERMEFSGAVGVTLPRPPWNSCDPSHR